MREIETHDLLKNVHKDWIIEWHNELLETMKESMRFI